MTLVNMNQHNSCLVLLFLIGFLVLLPLLVMFIAIVFGFALYFDSEFIDGSYYHETSIEPALKPERYNDFGERNNPFIYYIKLLLYYIFCLVFYSVICSICLVVGCIIGVLAIIPTYIYSFITMALIAK